MKAFSIEIATKQPLPQFLKLWLSERARLFDPFRVRAPIRIATPWPTREAESIAVVLHPSLTAARLLRTRHLVLSACRHRGGERQEYSEDFVERFAVHLCSTVRQYRARG